MKINEVSASFAFTKNMGNFQSMKGEATITAQLEHGEKVEEVFSKIFETAKIQVKSQLGSERGAVK